MASWNSQMSDNQNADNGDGQLDQQANNSAADGQAIGDSLTASRPKTSDSLKSLIAPTKTPSKSEEETTASPLSPKISTITGRVIPKSKTDATHAENSSSSASVTADTPPVVLSGEHDILPDSSPSESESELDGPTSPAPPSAPPLLEPDTEGLFSWSSPQVLDIMEDEQKPEIAKPGTTIDARISNTRLEAQIPTIQPHDIDEEKEPEPDETPAPEPPPTKPTIIAPVVTQPPAEPQTAKPTTTSSGLTAAIANRFGGKSTFTNLPTSPEPAESSQTSQAASPSVSQQSLPPVQPAAPNVSHPSLTPVQPAAPNNVSHPSLPPAQPAAPNVSHQSLPPVQPAAPNVSHQSPTPVQPTAPRAVPHPEPISIKAPAGYRDFNAENISDQEFFDEDELQNVSSPAAGLAPSQSSPTQKGAASTRKLSLIGQTLFDNYAVLDLIGEGSFCFVYTAMQLSNEEIVAVKTPKVLNQKVKEQFQNAVVKQGKLKHPHIVKSLHYLESPDGQPFYMMENQQGVTLEEILQSVEKLDDEDAIALILTQTASALEYAHNHQCTHDRLTPHNILLIDENEQLQVKVCDFQIATVADIAGDTTSKTRAMAYLSPETVRGEPATPQSDVYSLGALAFRMVTGHLPFDGRGRLEADQTPDPLVRFNPDLKRVHQLDEIVQEALDAEPRYRTDSVATFKHAVQEWIQAVHADYAAEPEYYTSEISIPDVLQAPPSEPNVVEPGIIQPTAPSQQPQPIDSAPGNYQPAPPVVPATELNELIHDVTPQQRRRIRRAQSRTGPQSIRSTIRELVALKKKQSQEEQSAAMKFTEQVAAQTAGPRRSPLATMTRLIAFIVVCGGLTIGCITFILTNPTQVREMYFQASRQLSMILPGRKAEPEEMVIEEGPRIVVEKPKIDLIPKKRKLKPNEIHATPPQWAVPREPGQNASSGENPSFGVTNNNTQSKRRPSRVRIEYRDYEDHPK